MRLILSITFVVILLLPLRAQDSLDAQKFKIRLPAGKSWNVGTEGHVFKFQLRSEPAISDNIIYSMQAPANLGMKLTDTGGFTWETNPGMVPEDQEEEYYYIQFFAESASFKDSVLAEIVLLKLPEITADVKKENNSDYEDTPEALKMKLPVTAGWNLLEEGDSIDFKVKVVGEKGQKVPVRFYLEEGQRSGISFDSTGHFRWSPPYEYVDRLQQTRDKHIFFIAEDEKGNIVSEKVILTVFHKNRKPTINNIPPFYVLQSTKNTFQIGKEYVNDKDNDPFVFIINPADLPEGFEFNSSGKVSWRPSRNQFNQLKLEPLKIPFFVEDQPSKERSLGFLMVEASSQDMPPEINMIPNESSVTKKENENIHFVFSLSDPNGDEDVERFGFVSEDERLTEDLLTKHTNNRYEFIWTPGYDFVNDPEKELEFEVRFFVIDQANQMSEKVVTFKVIDTEDLSKKDDKYYELYREVLVETYLLIDQLQDNQKNLEKDLRRAKKGKRNRALISATLGAITGISPVIAQDNAQKTISVIGGTSTMTLGSLEAKEVIGKSVNSINDKIKVNSELLTSLMSEGSDFARRYKSKADRRNNNFIYDVEKLKKLLNNPKITLLELEANIDSDKKVSDRQLKSAFTEFGLYDEN